MPNHDNFIFLRSRSIAVIFMRLLYPFTPASKFRISIIHQLAHPTKSLYHTTSTLLSHNNAKMPSSGRKLPPEIFNGKFYTSILTLWYSDLPYTQTPQQSALQKWYGLGISEAARNQFDSECRTLCGPALEALSPEKWPLDTYVDGETESANAEHIAKPFADLLLDVGENGEPKKENEGEDGARMHRADVALALVLLLDQMPRNVFRDSKMGALVHTHYDRLALAFTQSIVLPSPSPSSSSPSNSPLANIDLDPRLRFLPGRRLWFYLPLMHSENVADHDLLLQRWQDLKEKLESDADPEAMAYFEATVKSEESHRKILDRFGRYPHRNEILGREATEEETAWLEGGGERFGR
jgi:uncharacterized protein (DUF924 family)